MSRFSHYWLHFVEHAQANPRRTKAIIIPLALLALVGIYYYVITLNTESTDNAYVKAGIVEISTEVSARVTEILVTDNQHVEKGDLLFRLDRALLLAFMRRAEAQFNGVVSDIAGLKARYLQKQEEIKLAQVDAEFAERTLNRQQKLSKTGVVSDSAYDDASHALASARQRIVILNSELEEIRAELNGDPEIAPQDHPRYIEAAAMLEAARVALSHADVYAPASGMVSRLESLQVGDYVTQGRPLFSIVSDDDVWVEANFKETALTDMKPGNPATVTIDTYPGREWQGHVESISYATGAEFSLIPPQNATGNWVKVVQRIPVRIRLDRQSGDPELRAGMSAEVIVDTGHVREVSSRQMPATHNRIPTAPTHG